MDKKNSGQDEYLSLSKYEGHPTSDEHKGFSSFTHNDEHYFAMLSNSGSVQMRSEGYSSTKSRDNGITSVKKNRGLKERWTVIEEGGEHFIALKAGNHQEIARSGAFKSQADAEAALAAYLSNGTSWGAGAVSAAAGLAAGGGSDKGTNKDVLTDEDKEDDYLPTKEYEGHPINDKKNNIAHFKHENGQYYFALYNKEGKVKLRSEGFETAKNRDQELSGVLKYHNDDKMYTTLERGKFYMMVLKDETGREVGRSPLLKKTKGGTAKAAASAPTAPVAQDKGKSKSSGSGKVVAAGALGIASGKIVSESIISSSVISESRSNTGKETRNIISEKRNATGKETRNVLSEKRNVLSETKSKIKEDDYLKCEEYKGHTVTDTKNRIAKFKGKDGQLYFAAYYKDGSVRLRSEGFATEKGREDELKHAIKHLETAKSYSTIKKGKYYINVLKDGTGREVARSCMSTSVQNLITPIPIPPPVIKKVEKKVEKKVVAAKPVKKTPPPPPPKKVVPIAAAVAAPAAVAATTSSPWGCLKWLIPLLLLLLLLWWLFAIKGCGAAAPVAAVVPPPPPPPVVVEKVVPPPVAKTCNCSELTHPAFKLPSGPAEKVTTKLGLAPEYGKSTSLDPEGFYKKLKRRYDGSASERRFLDGIFKQMGYKNGFKDANASLFSTVSIPNGVSGNLGMKPSHVSVYRKMNLRNASQRSAFKIEAANACHMHFMKECGNHFFYGPCN